MAEGPAREFLSAFESNYMLWALETKRALSGREKKLFFSISDTFVDIWWRANTDTSSFCRKALKAAQSAHLLAWQRRCVNVTSLNGIEWAGQVSGKRFQGSQMTQLNSMLLWQQLPK
jgi:hypothetical protein